MRILLIRLRLIGDVIFTTPMIRAVRRQFPDAYLAYLVEPDAAPVVNRNPHIDDVIVADPPDAPRRWLRDLALVRRLRRARFDITLDLHGGPRSALFAWGSGAPRRVGYEIAGRRWMYTERVPRPRGLRPRHSVANQWDILAPFGVAPPDPIEDRTEMPDDPVVAATLDARWRSAGVRDDHRIVIVHVSAGNQFRRWPLESFTELIVRLVGADSQRRVVVTSGPSDAHAAADVARQVRAALGDQLRDAIVDSGELDLAELRAALGRAALFIGGDSGPLHVASTTRVPIVGLYGPTLPVRSGPWRDPALVSESVETGGLPCRPCDQRRCEPGDFRCLRQIPASAVAEAAERALLRSGQWPGVRR
jgi:ADP-heptose:LPS heptosyltransferase